MGVGGNAVDFDAQFLEFGVVVSQVFQLGWANEGEVGWVEENTDHLPFRSASDTSTKLPFLNAVALNGFTWLLMIGIVDSPSGVKKLMG